MQRPTNAPRNELTAATGTGKEALLPESER